MNKLGKVSAIALTFLAVTGVSLAQKYSVPKYTPPKVSAPRISAPRVSAPKVSAPRSAPQRTAPAPRSAPAARSAPSTRSSAPKTSSRSSASARTRAPKTQSQSTSNRAQARQQQQQQKAQARQQKAQAKQQQKQQKAQAKQQKHSPKGGNQTAASHPAAAAPAPAAATTQSHAAAAYHVPEGENLSRTGPTTLSKNGSAAVVGQVNSSRAHMTGINARPLPSGDVTVHANGHLTLAAAGGAQYGVRPNGTISSFRNQNTSATFNSHGAVTSIHTPTMSVSHGPAGRTIVTRGPDNSRIVSTGAHGGYVERNYSVGGRNYVQRTTIINHQVVVRNYVGYNYGGVGLNGFVAPFYYSPGFYGWAYNPWADPLAYDFGWGAEPWFGGPNPYFGAYGMYPSAAFWLTDFMIGQTISAAYQMHEDAKAEKFSGADYAEEASATENMNASGDSERLQATATTPLTPEIKDQIAEEVKQQIDIDKQNAVAQAEQVKHDELIAALNQPSHVFMVSGNLDVITDQGQNCGLEAGDVLKVMAAPGPDETIVQLRVAASKRSNCPAGVAVGVTLQDLQDMQNAFHAQVESGLGTLLAHQGDGIPAAPLDAVAGKPRPSVEGAPQVSANELRGMLDEQREQADQAETQLVASVQ